MYVSDKTFFLHAYIMYFQKYVQLCAPVYLSYIWVYYACTINHGVDVVRILRARLPVYRITIYRPFKHRCCDAISS